MEMRGKITSKQALRPRTISVQDLRLKSLFPRNDEVYKAKFGKNAFRDGGARLTAL